MEKVISGKAAFTDDLSDFTYDLMEGIVGKKNMTFERASNDVPVVGDSNALRPTYFAISNDRHVSYPYLNCVVEFNPNINIRQNGYIFPIIKSYPNLDNATNNIDRETLVKAAFDKQGLIEHVNYEFVSLEKLKSIVNEHNKSVPRELQQSNSSSAAPNIKGNVTKVFSDDLDDFTHALMESIVGKENMIFEKKMDTQNTEGVLYNIRDQVINQYKKEFPAIKHISEKTAQSIDSLNMQIGPLSIREIKEFYTAAGKELEANPTENNADNFNKYKDIVDGIKDAQSLECKAKAHESALINPAKTNVIEMSL